MNKLIWDLPVQVDITNIDSLGISKNIKEVLFRRGYITKEQIKRFLYPELIVKPYEHFPFLEKACKRIIQSISTDQTIAICGDYDADGMTSTALVVDALQRLNGSVLPLIPSRQEDGYGLNENIIENINNLGIKLLITVDNGVSATQAISLAKKYNIDIILTDHHKINNELDEVYALIHPETTPQESPFRSLAGVGISYILVEHISKILKRKDILDISKDLLCIGTIADMASLLGANRFWLKKWIHKLPETKCLGLKGIMAKAKLSKKNISSEDISFKIAPRINSIGRIDDPRLIIEMLLEKDPNIISAKVDRCEQINQRRRIITKEIEIEAFNILSKSNNKDRPFILLAQGHWHQGVIGIIAARIMEHYSKPTAILTSDNYGTFRGSARSPKGFNIINALTKCSDLLIKFGGHSAAAGFTVEAKNLMKLEEKLNLISTEWIKSSIYSSVVSPESYLNLSEISDGLIKDLNTLEPFGINNPKPLFWCRRCRIKNFKIGYLGQLFVTLEQENKLFNGVKWNTQTINLNKIEYLDIAYNLDIKNNKPIINLIDLREYKQTTNFRFNNRIYSSRVIANNELEIMNHSNDVYKVDISNDSELCTHLKKISPYLRELIKTSLAIEGLSYLSG